MRTADIAAFNASWWRREAAWYTGGILASLTVFLAGATLHAAFIGAPSVTKAPSPAPIPQSAPINPKPVVAPAPPVRGGDIIAQSPPGPVDAVKLVGFPAFDASNNRIGTVERIVTHANKPAMVVTGSVPGQVRTMTVVPLSDVRVGNSGVTIITQARPAQWAPEEVGAMSDQPIDDCAIVGGDIRCTGRVER